MLTFLCMLFHHISNMNLNYDIFLRMKNFDHLLFQFFFEINWLPYAYYYRKKNIEMFFRFYIFYINSMKKKQSEKMVIFLFVCVCVCIKKKLQHFCFFILVIQVSLLLFFHKKTNTHTNIKSKEDSLMMEHKINLNLAMNIINMKLWSDSPFSRFFFVHSYSYQFIQLNVLC